MPPCRLATTPQPSMHIHTQRHLLYTPSLRNSLRHRAVRWWWWTSGGGQTIVISTRRTSKRKGSNHSRLLAPPIFTAPCRPPVNIRVKFGSSCLPDAPAHTFVQPIESSGEAIERAETQGGSILNNPLELFL